MTLEAGVEIWSLLEHMEHMCTQLYPIPATLQESLRFFSKLPPVLRGINPLLLPDSDCNTVILSTGLLCVDCDMEDMYEWVRVHMQCTDVARAVDCRALKTHSFSGLQSYVDMYVLLF